MSAIGSPRLQVPGGCSCLYGRCHREPGSASECPRAVRAGSEQAGTGPFPQGRHRNRMRHSTFRRRMFRVPPRGGGDPARDRASCPFSRTARWRVQGRSRRRTARFMVTGSRRHGGRIRRRRDQTRNVRGDHDHSSSVPSASALQGRAARQPGYPYPAGPAHRRGRQQPRRRSHLRGDFARGSGGHGPR